MPGKDHWENVYTTKATDSVSWFQTHAERSLGLIHDTGLGQDAAIIDVGGGASVLVDDLLNEGYRDLTVLDLSGAALQAARKRLGDRSRQVHWIEADITEVELPKARYDIWHDRAVFHFLTTQKERDAYVRQVFFAVKPGGHVIISTFAEDGPEQCSGLPVMRYRADELHDEFGEAFKLMKHTKEAHQTPAGKVQQFVYCYCRRIGS
jgi:2-polyprenyl-3-methyl-5-hydroxy-6-metoxy-1,4-benzoquinol methylase